MGKKLICKLLVFVLCLILVFTQVLNFTTVPLKVLADSSNNAKTTLDHTEPPTAPTNLTYQEITSTTVRLSWEPSIDNLGVIGYNIYTCCGQVGWVPYSQTTYVVTELEVDTTYGFRVRAVDAAGNESDDSNIVTVATRSTPVFDVALGMPSAGSSFKEGYEANNGNDGNSSTYWLAKDDGTEQWWFVYLEGDYALFGTEIMWEKENVPYQYKIEVMHQTGNWLKVVDKTDNTNALQVQADNFSTVGSYLKVTVTGVPEGVPVGIREFKVFGTLNVPPTAPKSLRLIAKTDTTVTLEWDASEHNIGIDVYEVVRGCVTMGITSGENTSITIADLTPETSYTFVVFARDGFGLTSPVSNDITVTTNPELEDIALNKPTSASSETPNNIAKNGNDGQMLTSWRAANEGPGSWWQVDLIDTYDIVSAEISWEKPHIPYQYQIDVSEDGVNWTTTVDETDNADAFQSRIIGISASARYVRVTVTGVPDGERAGITELKIFGKIKTYEFPLVISSGTIDVHGGIIAQTTVEAMEDCEGVIIFKLMKGVVPVALVAIEESFVGGASEKFTAQFPQETGVEYWVKVFVWDKLDNSMMYAGVDLALPKELASGK